MTERDPELLRKLEAASTDPEMRRKLDEWRASYEPEIRVGRRSRDSWHPVVGRLYGILPWDMGRLTLREVRAISDDLEAISKAAA